MVEHRQDVSVVCLHGVLLERCENVSKGRVRLHDISNKSEMKYPRTSQWYVTKTS